MRVYSVGEAIGPAWDRTQKVLRTGRIGTNIKLILSIILAEMGSLLVLPFQGVFLFGIPHQSGLPITFHAVWMLFALIFTVIAGAVYFALFYFGSRMQLVLVDLVLLRVTTIAPLWRRHKQSVWRWCLVKLAPSAVLMVALVPLMLRMAHMTTMLAAHPVAPSTDPQVQMQAQMEVYHHLFAGMAAALLVVFVLFSSAVLLYSQMRDFVMPFLGVDQVSAGEALSRWFQLWRDRTGEMLGYFFFRILLVIGAFVVLYLTVAILVGIPLGIGLVALVLLKSLTHSTLLAGVFGGIGIALLYLFAMACFFAGWAVFCMFFQCYSLYFLGGRDARIGALLEPYSFPTTWTPPPSMPSDDESDGPDLPMDPALA